MTTNVPSFVPYPCWLPSTPEPEAYLLSLGYRECRFRGTPSASRAIQTSRANAAFTTLWQAGCAPSVRNPVPGQAQNLLTGISDRHPGSAAGTGRLSDATPPRGLRCPALLERRAECKVSYRWRRPGQGKCAQPRQGCRCVFQGMNSGDRKEKAPAADLAAGASGTFRYAVGLGIPRPVARLQSRTPLPQAKVVSARSGRGLQPRAGRGTTGVTSKEDCHDHSVNQGRPVPYVRAPN